MRSPVSRSRGEAHATEAPIHRSSFTLTPAPPFELAVVARSHGWFDLPPFEWSPDSAVLKTSFLVDTTPVTVTVRASSDRLRCVAYARESIEPCLRKRLAGVVSTVLRLGEDLSEFYELASKDDRLDWVVRRGAGRLLRSPSVFEDVLKTLSTTNCSWALTRKMVVQLLELAGTKAPLESRCFPAADRLAHRRIGFFRDRVRAGYRAPHFLAIAKAQARGTIDCEGWRSIPSDGAELKEQLLSLPGIGPYAAGILLRLLGHYEEPALDSWCRSQFRRMYGARAGRTDSAILQRYRKYGRFLGLALWMDLTRHWHLSLEDGHASV